MNTGTPVMFYCGCHRDSGHHLWTADETTSSTFWQLQPWGYAVDGDLQPRPKNGFHLPNGIARFTQEHGWSALSWWDNSIDTRPGSHSTFIVHGTYLAEEVLAMARARFPWVFARFQYQVVLPGGGR